MTPMSRTQIEHLADLAARFSSRILLEHKNRIINGKSMLGLLSLGDTGGERVDLICDGEDEEMAAQAMMELIKSGITPPKTAADAYALLQKIKARYAELLEENLVGIYLHGSLAEGSFRWASSDIDFLAVVKEPPALEKKIALVQCLFDMEKDAPPKGLEMSVVLARYCRQSPYPIPFELHYSPMHRRAFEADPRGYCRTMHGEDPDLSTHILSLCAHGRAVLGPDIPRVFDQVKREDALSAMRQDLGGAAEHIHENPEYYILNLCRALAYRREGRVLSKRAGGEWALHSVPNGYQPLIQAALNACESGLDMTYDEEQAEEFCAEALREIMD